MKFYIFLCCLIIIPIGFISCSKPEVIPPLSFADNFVNKQILLKVPRFGNTLNVKDPIFLDILCYSEDKIIFPNNYNLRLFVLSDRTWAETEEIPTTRFPAGEVTLCGTNGKSIESFAIVPELQDYENNYQLRIYVIGEIKTDSDNQKVAAYVDVTLHP